MTEAAHLSDSDLAGFVENRLDPAARRWAVAHLDTCDECRADLIAITGLVSGAPVSSSHRLIVSSHRRRAWTLAGAGALAAGLAGILVYRGAIDSGTSTETVRTPVIGSADAAPRIVAVGPRDGASLQADSSRSFTWRAYEADNYRFLLLEEDGTPLWTFDTHDTVLVLPPDVSLVGGRTYFWRVDAHADGITASTGTMRLQVVR